MKNTILNRTLQVLAAAVFSLAAPAQAQMTTQATKRKPRPTKPQPKKPTPQPAVGKKTVTLNPDILRAKLMDGDNTIIEGLTGVMQAKEQSINQRNGLLPGLNLGAALSSSGFGLGTISILLPFLLPSNWYAVDEADANLSATGYGFYVTELNEYANALALYQNCVNDIAVLTAYQKIANDYYMIEEYIQDNVNFGTSDETQLEQAHSQTQKAIAQIEATQGILQTDEDALLQMLGLKATQYTAQIDDNSLPPDPNEDLDPEKVYEKMYMKAPEYLQMQSLIKAAQAAKMSTTFSFFGGSALSLTPNGSGNNGTSGGWTMFGQQVSAGASLNLSPQLGSQIELAELNVKLMQQQMKALADAESELIQATMDSIQSAKAQVLANTDSEQAADDAFEKIMDAFKNKAIDYNSLNTAGVNAENATVARVTSQIALDNSRVTFARTIISGEFAKIRHCVLKNGAEPNPITGFFQNLFGGGGNATQTVDKLCRN